MKKNTKKKIILVNPRDKIIGFEGAECCHQGQGLLHRAFTIFIFNHKNQVLIQQRSRFKKLWPLFWETSCSSHPQKGETNLQAAKRRLKEELGIGCHLKFLGKFQYQVPYKKIGSENEVCSLLVGRSKKKFNHNSKEVVNWKWISLGGLKKDVGRRGKKYAPWLKPALMIYEKISVKS